MFLKVQILLKKLLIFPLEWCNLYGLCKEQYSAYHPFLMKRNSIFMLPNTFCWRAMAGKDLLVELSKDLVGHCGRAIPILTSKIPGSM